MNPKTDVNLNHADCLRSVSDFGKTIVHNICNGSIKEVPWGSVDWMEASFLIAFGAFLVLMLAAMVIAMFKAILSFTPDD
jgi:hypothetical protein